MIKGKIALLLLVVILGLVIRIVVTSSGKKDCDSTCQANIVKQTVGALKPILQAGACSDAYRQKIVCDILTSKTFEKNTSGSPDFTAVSLQDVLVQMANDAAKAAKDPTTFRPALCVS